MKTFQIVLLSCFLTASSIGLIFTINTQIRNSQHQKLVQMELKQKELAFEDAKLKHQLEESTKKEHQLNLHLIEQMNDICEFNKITDKEQATLKACGDDSVKYKQVLFTMIDERVRYCKDCQYDLLHRAEGLRDYKNKYYHR